MPDSMESAFNKKSSTVQAGLLPRLRSLGSFVILVMMLAFIAGRIRNELALTLLGTVFLIILTYCFLGVLFLGIIHRRLLNLLSMTLTSETTTVGGKGELCISFGGPLQKNSFWRLPMVLTRCELHLKTGDSRVIRHFANPDLGLFSSFLVKERGAYHSSHKPGENNRLLIFDAPGFFRINLPIRQNASLQFLAVPSPAEKGVTLSPKSGGTEGRKEPHYRKSDDLIEHRPYVPGDDPRRINWKLYSHSHMGELFVREGDNHPPPHSRLLVLIDTEADRSLYSLEEGRQAVDLLCENALNAALEFSARGMDILAGYTGGKIISGADSGATLNAAQLASAMALPYAIPWPEKTNSPKAELPWADLPGADLPRANLPRANLPHDLAVLIFALPRKVLSGEPSPDSSALDRFIKTSRSGAKIVFLYSMENKRADELEDAANTCLTVYNGRHNIYAVKAVVPQGGIR